MNVTEITSDLNAELTGLNADPHVAPSQVTACIRLAAGMKKLLRDAVNEPLPRVEHLSTYIHQLRENLSGTESDIEMMGNYVLESGKADDLFRLKVALLCRDALIFKIKMLTDVQETLRQIETEMRGYVNEWTN